MSSSADQTGRADKEHGENGDKGGEASVAGYKAVGQHGNEALPGRVDNPAAGDAGGVASKAHTHGQALFAAGAGLFKGVIQVEGHPGKIAEVLQQGEQGEEDGHWGEHHRHHPGQHPVHSLGESQHHAGGQSHPGEDLRQGLLQAEQQVGQQLGWVVGPRNGDPEHHCQQEQHNGNTRLLAGKEPIQLTVPHGLRGGNGRGCHHLAAQILGGFHQGGGHSVLQPAGVQPGLCQQV